LCCNSQELLRQCVKVEEEEDEEDEEDEEEEEERS